MKILILFLLSPVVICSQHYSKTTNPNDEPFLPIHSEYPYNPKLIKRGIQQHQEQQPQTITQLNPEIYASKVDSRDSFSTNYGHNTYYPSYSPYIKTVSTPSTLTSSSYFQSPYASNNVSPYNSLNALSSPYSSFSTGYGTNSQNFGISPYSNMGIYPNYYYNQPYYYPNYYNQPPYIPPPSGYPNRPMKYQNENNDEDDDDDYEPREKNKKNVNKKNRSRNSDRESDNNQYVDGTNFVISSSKDLDGESSTHRIPSHYNQIEQESDVPIRTATQPKATYRLVSVSGQQPTNDYNTASSGYVKVQQLEQLMRQALAKLLAQNAVQQENLARIQQEVNKQQNGKSNQHYVTVPSTIAKTGLSYVVNPMILNRVNSAQSNTNINPYANSDSLQTQAIIGGNNHSSAQKSATSVTLQQSPGIYIPPSKISNDQSSSLEYSDYDSSESITSKSQQEVENFQATVEPTRKSYLYSTYRPTQQTNLEDVNFGSKQKISSKS